MGDPTEVTPSKDILIGCGPGLSTARVTVLKEEISGSLVASFMWLAIFSVIAMYTLNVACPHAQWITEVTPVLSE